MIDFQTKHPRKNISRFLILEKIASVLEMSCLEREKEYISLYHSRRSVRVISVSAIRYEFNTQQRKYLNSRYIYIQNKTAY